MSQEITFNNCRPLKECLACGGKDLKLFLDLGNQPLANNYKNEEADSPEQQKYPLQSLQCKACSHIQLSVSVLSEILFKQYSYVSGTTRTLHSHFQDIAKEYVLKEDYFTALDIASNDGSLALQLKEAGAHVWGVDPAQNLQRLSWQKEIPTLVDFWSLELAKKLNIKFDLITALNVLGHNDNPLDFLLGCKEVLEKNGRILIEFVYAKNMLKDGAYDQIYHEHYSTFTVQSFQKLCQRAGLICTDLREVPVHGRSIRFILRREGEQSPYVPVYIEAEQANLPLYDEFSAQVREKQIQLLNQIDKYRKGGYKIVGYGAAAKTTVVLNSIPAQVDFVIDENSLKHNLYIPGTNAQIKPPAEIQNLVERPTLFIIFSWNFKDEIIEKIAKLREYSSAPTKIICSNEANLEM